MKNCISKLVIRYFHKRHTPEIEIKIQRWLINGEHSAEKDKALTQIWEQIENKINKSVYTSLKEVNNSIGIRSSRGWFTRRILPHVAAIFVPIFIITCIWFNNYTRIGIVEVATTAGEQREVILPDGSTVWMNACSKITYPERFIDSVRNIHLTGEAYFSVVKNKNKRFWVTTKELTVEVLGTRFNVKAYPDDNSVTTTLTSGQVAVSLPDGNYTLRPSQELIYNPTDRNATIRNATDNAAGWRDGLLIFNELTLCEIFKVLERQFDVKFSYSPKILPSDRYSVKFNPKEGLNQILKVLEDVTGVFTHTPHDKIITITIK